MIGSLVREVKTGIVGIVIDTYIFMAYKDKNGEQVIERDFYVKWNDGENYWISADRIEVLSKSSS
jgi:hypothetical protein